MPPPATPAHGHQAPPATAIVAHELRSALTPVIGTLAMLRERGAQLSRAEQQELLGLALEQAARLRRLTDQLLLAADPTTPRTAARPVDAAQLARHAARLAGLAHPARPVAVDAAEALPVRADPDATQAILANLLDNAAKHTPSGTPIRLEAARRGALAVLAVEDAGRGVPAAARARVFEPFEQLQPASGRAGGIGLGLHIARRLARAQAGELLITDPLRSPHGVRFELHLPIDPEPPAPTRLS